MVDKNDKAKPQPKSADPKIVAERSEQGKLVGQGLSEIVARALGVTPPVSQVPPTPEPKLPKSTAAPWYADKTLWIVGGGSLALLGLLAILTRGGGKRK
jgi:hypothetical protein